MDISSQWITPFLKQCFVTAGVSINMASAGLTMGYSVGLLEQLRASSSGIPVDDSMGSWIAALPAISLVVGNFIAPSLMSAYGRKTANLISIFPLIFGWTLIVFAENIPMILIARFFQGLSMGMSSSLGSLLIGEYTSPRNRGALLMTISISIAGAVLFVHTLGSYIHWRLGAVACGTIAFVDLLIVLWSPESPSWLADKGRYEECKKVFRWLRGNDEEAELTRMIEAMIIIRESKNDASISETLLMKLKKNIVYFNTTITKREFYKPVIIMMHIYLIAQWSGVNILVAYASDLFHKLVGKDVNVSLLVISLDAHRIVANILAIYIVRKVKRRVMLFTTVGINIFALFATAAYTFILEKQALSVNHPLIGILLTHCLMFAVATGTLSLSYIIAGEIFPLEFKNLAGGISMLFLSANMFVSVKTVPYFFIHLGLHGTYCLYGAILSYCLLVSWVYLPETKDRTLQEIEDELRGRPLTVQELQSLRSLTSWTGHDSDRRCSVPIIVV